MTAAAGGGGLLADLERMVDSQLNGGRSYAGCFDNNEPLSAS